MKTKTRKGAGEGPHAEAHYPRHSRRQVRPACGRDRIPQQEGRPLMGVRKIGGRLFKRRDCQKRRWPNCDDSYWLERDDDRYVFPFQILCARRCL